MSAKNESSEIRITRVYDAPVALVWDAWTDPKRAAKWWGPRGFTITTHSKDLRPGGHWSYTMHGPDGKDYENTTKYFEVEKPKKLVYDHGGHEDRPPLFRVTVLFSESRGKTKMEMAMALPTAQAAEETRKFVKSVGGESTWDRLAEYLARESTGKEEFVINRAFDASLETMWRMWTDPKHFSQWLPPTGFQMEFLSCEIRPGGEGFYKMFNDAGMTMHGRVNYLEIEKPRRIVYTQQFADAQGNLARHPMAPTWPATMKTTVTLAEEGPGRTRITVLWEVVGDAAAEEMETFVKGRAGMTQGWTGSFDKLEAYIEKQ